jgi:formylglycine-generating enzyme required for sulfatase activity
VKKNITLPFAMMATQVTQIMWAKLMIAMGEIDVKKINPSHFTTGVDSARIKIAGFDLQMKAAYPVEQVSWNDVQNFIEGLNLLSNADDQNTQSLLSELIPNHQKGDLYDFPTEVQWEFVMRNRGSANKLYFDRDDIEELSKYAWFDENSGKQTHKVGTRIPRKIDGNYYYDLEGNVFEWTKDSYTDFARVIRGCSWSSSAGKLTSGYRNYDVPGLRYSGLGIRLVRTRK